MSVKNQSEENLNIKDTKKASKQHRLIKFLRSGLIFLSIVALGAASFVLIKSKFKPTLPPSPVSEKISFKKFTSKEEFATYLKKTAGAMTGFFGMGLRESVGRGEGVSLMEAPERVSETTVQVKGIDEPDIVKTDGHEIYFSSEQQVFRRVVRPVETKVIKAFPPTDLVKEAKIEKTGNLLLADNMLVIFSDENKIYGYDVSNPALPKESWKVDFENNNFLADARLYQGKIYFVTQARINTITPCPFVPLSIDGSEFSVRCTDVYRPNVDVPVDVTFNAFVLEPATGKIEKSVSFVGTTGSSVLFMSRSALYATFTYYEDIIEFYYQFFLENGQGLIPDSIVERLKVLKGYDISNQAKLVEFQNIYERYLSSLSSDERLKVENEYTNRLEDYSEKHKRELERTGIVKIGLSNLDILATGSIPGRPLNQFSLDEYQNYLRVATTVGGGMFGAGESANDVYVLDSDLQIKGSVVDLGLGERIYSARFIEDKGYLVTFKQIDPFFVLDLTDPGLPKVKGELKIPGYSSYLHPVTKDKILGVGKEGSQVKISLFDVTSPDNPTEMSKYMLDEFWSDILNTHHAFLLDSQHQVFFLPGSKGGYIFSYQEGRLELTRAVADIRARRAIYINDYLYIIGDNKIVVLNEIDWAEVNELEF